MRIVVLDGYTLNPGDLSWDKLNALGEVEIFDRTSPELVFERSENADVLLTNKVIIDAAMMAKLPALKYVGVLATGYNVVDIKAAAKNGIVVTNIPSYSTDSVAQMVFAHILNFTQMVSKHAKSVREGTWSQSVDFMYTLTPLVELNGKILGIVGFGKIGQAVARIAQAFGMEVIFHNRSIKKDVPEGIKQVSLKKLFSESDYISLNCPLTEENQGFVNKELLSYAKKSVFIINTGRGPLLNEQDVADALNSEIIAGLGADVLSAEPPKSDNPLLKARNCYITPHMAWATKEARIRLLDIAVENILHFRKGKPINKVN